MPNVNRAQGVVVVPQPKEARPAVEVAAAVVAARADGFEVTTPKQKIDADLEQVKQLQHGFTGRGDEKKIIELFRNAPADELNQLVDRLQQHEFHELIDDLNDRWIGPDYRTEFLQLLSSERLGELTVDSRAKVIATLQYHETTGLDEQAIRNIFVGTHGAELSTLKTAIDHGGDYRDLQQLVFHDIDSPTLRAEILQHFATEGATPNGQLKVLSDVDDTFYENWVDDRYPKQTVYPGVREFYRALDQGGAAEPQPTGDLMFLSARPYDRPGVSEGFSQAMLQKQGITDAAVLSGDFLHLIGNGEIAAKKFDNWQQVGSLYPEYKSVFIGDSGQGDAIFGERAAATANTSMQAVFIHNVTNMGEAEKQAFAAKGVTVFDTYVGAATEAFRMGLISKDGLQKVAVGATEALAAVHFDSPQKAAARSADLERDLAAMQAALNAAA